MAPSCTEETKKRNEKDLADRINEVGTVEGYPVHASSGSIRIRFICFDNDHVNELQRLYTSRRLDEVFCDMLITGESESQLESLELTFDRNEFDICRSEMEKDCYKFMSPAHQRALCFAQGELAGRINVSGTFLKQLDLCTMHMAAIIAETSSGEQARTLLAIVAKQPDPAFGHLINVLRATGQEDQANELAARAGLEVGNNTKDTVTANVDNQLGNRSGFVNFDPFCRTLF